MTKKARAWDQWGVAGNHLRSAMTSMNEAVRHIPPDDNLMHLVIDRLRGVISGLAGECYSRHNAESVIAERSGARR